MSFNSTEFLSFWFTTMKPYWFGCPVSIDQMVNDKWSSYLDYPFTTNINDLEQTLAQIILYDQISRHVFRFREQMEKIQIYDKNALELTNSLYLSNKLIELNPEQRCFALMPWRHSKNEMAIIKCLNLVTEWMETESAPMYNRFYQATVKSIAKINNSKYLGYYKFHSDLSTYRPVLDPTASYSFDFDIGRIDLNHKLVKEFRKHCAPVNNELIISVSGGVDSMVCLFIAKALYPKWDIKAISINYANREEQSVEIDMVNYVCQKIDVEHNVRVINEIKRVRDSHRSFYESITREIRFECYKNVMVKPVPVVLGHNQDDTLENVFSNIKKRINYDNLFGMVHTSCEKGVTIVRPLLEIPKCEIIAFAHEYNIPYTYDSTPSWCERGRLRDVLMPSLRTFDRDLVPGIIEMANNYKQIYSVYKKSIPEVLGAGFINEYYVNCDFNIDILDYWKQIFTNAANEAGVSFVSNKSIQHFISQIKVNDNNDRRKVILSKDLYAIINKSRSIIEIYVSKN